MAAIDANAIAPHTEASAARRTRFRMSTPGIKSPIDPAICE